MTSHACADLRGSRMDSVLESLEEDQLRLLERLAVTLNTTILQLFHMVAAASVQPNQDHYSRANNLNCVQALLSLAVATWVHQDPNLSVDGSREPEIYVDTMDYVLASDHKQPFVVLGLVCSVLMIAVAIIGIIGNAVSVWYFGRLSAKSSINIMLTAMAVFDCVLLLTGAPLYSLVGIHSYTGYDNLVRSLSCCLVYFYTVSTMSQTATAWMLVLITFERAVAVCKPFLARRLCTIGRARKAVLSVSLFAVAYNLVRLWEFESDARPLLRNHPYYRTIYMHWMYLTLVFLIPFTIIAFLNAMIIRSIRIARLDHWARRVHSGSSSKSSHTTNRLQAEHRTAAMLLVVVLVFMGCEVLAPVLNAMEMVGRNNDPHLFSFLSDLNNLLVLLHSAINVGIYVGFCSDYRRVCRRIMAAITRFFCCHYSKPRGNNLFQFSPMDGTAWRHRASIASVNGAAFSHTFKSGGDYAYLGLHMVETCQMGKSPKIEAVIQETDNTCPSTTVV